MVYLTSIIDLYSRKIISWVLNTTLESKWINRFKILDYKHAEKLVFEYIETFYNTVRIHSHCGYLSPNKYEDKYYS